MQSRLSKLLSEKGIKYWDYRYETTEGDIVSIWNKEIKDLKTRSFKGFCVRVLYKNAWGFASGTEDLEATANKALALAKSLSSVSKTKIFFSESKPFKARKKSSFKINPRDIDLRQKKDLLMDLSKVNDTKIKSINIVYSDSTKKMFFCNSEGSDIEQELTYTLVGTQATASDGKNTETFFKRNGSTKGYEITKFLPKMLESTIKKSKQLLSASVPKGGMFPVICDGQLTDVFVHEAVGHASEADLYFENDSCFKGKFNKQLGAKFLNIYDDSTKKGSWGFYFFDSEGTPAKKTPIIKNGVLNTLMTSRETASKLKLEPSGNARAESYKHIPQVRMSETYIEKGAYSEEELYEDIKYGFLLKGSRGGQVDTKKGNFLFNAVEGYLIEQGKLTTPLRQVSLGGNTLKILKQITKISNKYDEGFPGHCGKGGQYVPAAGSCPSILIEKAHVGGK